MSDEATAHIPLGNSMNNYIFVAVCAAVLLFVIVRRKIGVFIKQAIIGLVFGLSIYNFIASRTQAY